MLKILSVKTLNPLVKIDQLIDNICCKDNSAAVAKLYIDFSLYENIEMVLRQLGYDKRMFNKYRNINYNINFIIKTFVLVKIS